MSVQEQIVAYLKERASEWVAKETLAQHPFKNEDETDASSETITRKARLAEEKSQIAVKHTGDKSSSVYRFIPEPYRKNYIPIAQRIADGLPDDCMWVGQAKGVLEKEKHGVVAEETEKKARGEIIDIRYFLDGRPRVRRTWSKEEAERALQELPQAVIID